MKAMLALSFLRVVGHYAKVEVFRGFRLVDMISRIVGAVVEPTPVAVEADADSLTKLLNYIAKENSKYVAHPDNLVGIIVMGERDLNYLLLPTNDFEDVKLVLGSYKDHMNKRIVVFAGGPPPLYIADKHLKPVVEKFKEDTGVVVDVVDFFPVVKESKEPNLRMLVDCMNEQTNDVNRVGQYFRVPEDGKSVSHHLSTSPILPPLVAKGGRRKKKQKKHRVHSAQIRKKKHPFIRLKLGKRNKRNTLL
ncbi:hypothetical protein Tco_0556391 [Tanacetum coccineum]